MSKKQIKRIAIMGAGCVFLLFAGIIYSFIFNDNRFVKEMNMSEYVFSIKDVPMLAIGVLIAVYVIYIVIICMKTKAALKKTSAKNYTRKISPFLGIFGFFGFLGLGGFWTYKESGIIFPFIFFIFFGFFGFFFEGKLSHTLEDELFRENKRKAEIKAYKTGFMRLFFFLAVICYIGMKEKSEGEIYGSRF